MDKLTTQQRHNNMAAIRSKDTKPEIFDDLPFTIENSDCCKIQKTNREF